MDRRVRKFARNIEIFTRYIDKISINFCTIFRKEKTIQKRKNFFSNHPNIHLYLRSTQSQILRATRDQTPEPASHLRTVHLHTYIHTHTYTRVYAHTFTYICTESFSDRKFDGSSNNGMDPCVHIPVHKCGILLRVGGTRQRLSPRCDTGAGVARGRSVKENARRRKKREEDEGRGLVDESNRRREEGTGNLSEERRLRATRDLFAWAKSLRAVLVYIYIYIYSALGIHQPVGGVF